MAKAETITTSEWTVYVVAIERNATRKTRRQMKLRLGVVSATQLGDISESLTGFRHRWEPSGKPSSERARTPKHAPIGAR